MQFSLMTMLVVVTAVAAFLAYHVNWIRSRHEMLNSGGIAAGDGPSSTISFDPAPPRMLGWFGEGAYGYIVVFPADDDRQLTAAEQAKVRRVAQLFPEAAVEAHFPP
jgi:hypothetical protein